MTSSRASTSHVFALLPMALLIGACGSPANPTPTGQATPSPDPSEGMALTDLSVIGCAAADPADEGELTGAWAGNDGGTYWIRHVGDCVWWFGTEVREIERGVTDQRGFANVASGRIVGRQIDLEWADIPLGDTVNGGGLTFTYDEASDQLTLVEQRGGAEIFGGSLLTRIEPSPNAAVSPSPLATP